MKAGLIEAGIPVPVGRGVFKPEQIAKMKAGRKAGKRGGISHTVKTVDGGKITFANYTKGLAVKIHCTKCMGDETDPKDCTSPFCALYPFRRKTRAHNHAEGSNGQSKHGK